MAENYQTVARVGEIPEAEGRSFEVDGRYIAVFLDGGGYYAMDDSCPHQGAPLCDGIVAGKTVTCSWHGWQFRLEDGGWADNPSIRVRTYPVRVEGDEVQLMIGED